MSKGKIGVLIEHHFSELEYRRYNERFPELGYEVEYLSDLWGYPELTFTGNDNSMTCTVTKDIRNAQPSDYRAIVLIGGYSMDRLRYQDKPQPLQHNAAPAVDFLRKAVVAMDSQEIRIGTVCHALWLFCADPDLIKGRTVTCSHNIMSDVINAGANYAFAPEGGGVEVHVDGGLITGRHPGVVEAFMDTLVREIER
jgi:putative intracellular protease/amidase